MVPQAVDPKAHTFHSPKFGGVVEEAIEFLVRTPVHALPPAPQFFGVGVYALYYLGHSEFYRKLGEKNRSSCDHPVYVGKASPAGWRTARAPAEETTLALNARLREHARSIEQGMGLMLGEFRCRFMILHGIETDLVSAVEAQLIRRFMPLWNTLVDGFGNHDPGKGRYNQAKSEWDVLHPGRPWAERLTGISPRRERVIEKIQSRT